MILPSLIDAAIERALAEDLAGGDISAEACVSPETRATAEAFAKTELVACGADVFARVFTLVDPSIAVERLVPDGTVTKPKTVMYRVEGPARTMLMAERTALNFVQRMSGTATLARRCVDALTEGSRTRITDTRKTTPGLRVFERYAVRVGGAINHRDQLGSAVMIKDNHIVAAGGITEAVRRARDYAPHTSKIEVEVTDHDELAEATGAGADIVMLDNFTTEDVRRALAFLEKVVPRPLVEVSGGITEERIAELSALGVDVISVGALTHSAKAADISLDFRVA